MYANEIISLVNTQLKMGQKVEAIQIRSKPVINGSDDRCKGKYSKNIKIMLERTRQLRW